MSPLKWLLTHHLKPSSAKQKLGGFTLIELLVGMILAVLVITPLLGFMVNVMDNDRREQAKTNTEQELKTAIDYIKRDLEQAVYIYDDSGIDNIRSKLPRSSAADQKTYFPVLVFWKRQYIKEGLTVGTGKNDTFVYSLVAYYLINDGNATWSKAARIGRFQISNGYGVSNTDIDSSKDDGFEMFKLDGEGVLKTKMNKWKNPVTNATDYTQDILPLVDYIDQTPISSTTNPEPTCPAPPVTTPITPPMQLVPKFSGSGGSLATDSVKIRGFYVCVNSDNTIAEVYLRGNALARIQNDRLDFNSTDEGKKSYFPQATIRVKGRGFIFTQ
jgi:type II secretory pathway pseudopilin PulG